MGEQARFASRPLPRNTIARELQRESHIHSEGSESRAARPSNPEPYQQPLNRMPSLPDFPHPLSFTSHRGGRHPGFWYTPHGSLADPDEDISMVSWPSQQPTSHMSGRDGFCNPLFSPWVQNTALQGPHASLNMNGSRPRKDKSARQVMMALRDDQFGQILEAISPSKKPHDPLHGLPLQHDARQPVTQTLRPPKMGTLSVPVRPSSTSVARTTSHPDLNAALRNCAKRPLSDQANFDISTASMTAAQAVHQTNKKESRDMLQSRMPTPNPFMLAPQRQDSDIFMRDGSSNFSSLSRFERGPAQLGSKIGSAHAPSAGGNLKSRKEGLATDDSDLLNVEVRHDQDLLPDMDASTTAKSRRAANDPDRTPRSRQNDVSTSVPKDVEIIDVDAIDPSLVAEATAGLAGLSPFKPSHKAGKSSISSTGRLERQLYSALSEELGSFQAETNDVAMGLELTQALSITGTYSDLSGSTMLNPTVDEFEPVGKRKRQGTIGNDRDLIPMKKKEKAQPASIEDDDIPEDMPRLRGD